MAWLPEPGELRVGGGGLRRLATHGRPDPTEPTAPTETERFERRRLEGTGAGGGEDAWRRAWLSAGAAGELDIPAVFGAGAPERCSSDGRARLRGPGA